MTRLGCVRREDEDFSAWEEARTRGRSGAVCCVVPVEVVKPNGRCSADRMKSLLARSLAGRPCPRGGGVVDADETEKCLELLRDGDDDDDGGCITPVSGLQETANQTARLTRL